MVDPKETGLWGRVSSVFNDAESLKQIIESRREHSKLRYDRYKHQTTLASGTILIICALLGSTFEDAMCLFIALVSVILLLVSAVLGFVAMGFITEVAGSEDFMFMALGDHKDIEQYEQMHTRMERFETAAKWSAWTSVGFLIFGLLSFAWFALQNLSG